MYLFIDRDDLVVLIKELCSRFVKKVESYFAADRSSSLISGISVSSETIIQFSFIKNKEIRGFRDNLKVSEYNLSVLSLRKNIR